MIRRYNCVNKICKINHRPRHMRHDSYGKITIIENLQESEE
jgi:hypothetical protein